MEAIGSGMIIIIDGHTIGYNNIADIADNNPISVENLTVHFLAKGNKYTLDTRKYIGIENEEYAKTEVE
jgi:cyanophycinase